MPTKPKALCTSELRAEARRLKREKLHEQLAANAAAAFARRKATAPSVDASELAITRQLLASPAAKKLGLTSGTYCPLDPIGLNQEQAAVFVGLSPTTFALLVKDGRMPGARMAGSRKIWVTRELDAAVDKLPREGERAVTSVGVDARRHDR